MTVEIVFTLPRNVSGQDLSREAFQMTGDGQSCGSVEVTEVRREDIVLTWTVDKTHFESGTREFTLEGSETSIPASAIYKTTRDGDGGLLTLEDVINACSLFAQSGKAESDRSTSEADRAKREADRAQSIVGGNFLTPQSDIHENVATFEPAQTRVNLASGETVAVLLGKISRWFSDLSGVAFSGSFNDLVDKPSAMDGEDGATFTPSVSEGTLSWTNDKNLPNPEPVNIVGPPGEPGAAGPPGSAGRDGLTTSVNNVQQVNGNVSLKASNIPIDPITGMTASNVQEAVAANFQSVVDGKASLETAITDKGAAVSKVGEVATFTELSDAIRSISTGTPDIEIGFTANLIGEEAVCRELPSLSTTVARARIAVTSVGNEAIFAGGDNSVGANPQSTVDAINPLANTARVLKSLSVARAQMGAATVGNEAIFAGGYINANSCVSTVDAINTITNTQRVLVSFSEIIPFCKGFTISDEAVFVQTRFVEAINPATNTIRKVLNLPIFPNAISGYAARMLGEEIIAGGNNFVYAMNPVSGTARTLVNLSQGRSYLTASVVGDEMIFLGGNATGNISTTVDAVNPLTNTMRVLTSLPEALAWSTSETLGGEAVVLGGNIGSNNGSAKIHAVNPALNTARTLKSLKAIKHKAASVLLKGEAIIGGGLSNAQANFPIVEGVSIGEPNRIAIPPLALTNGLLLDTDVSLESDSTYLGQEYPTNAKIPYNPDTKDITLRNVPSGTTAVNGKYYIKQGDYQL